MGFISNSKYEDSHTLQHEESHLQAYVLPHIKSGMMLSERLKKARHDAKLTQKELADRARVDQSAISNIERGVAVGSTKLVQIAAVLGVTAEWLLTGEQETHTNIIVEPKANYSTKQQFTILQYDTGGMGGKGLVLRDQPGVIEQWTVNKDWLRANLPHYSAAKSLAIVTGFGDSMPEVYSPGDPVLVDTGVTQCDHDGIYFFRVGDEGFIKRLQRIPGQGIRVLSQNPEYEAWTVTPDMDFAVMGKVLRAWTGKNY